MRLLLGIPLLLGLFAVPSQAQERALQAQERNAEIGQGVLCDTAPQVKRFVALRDNGKDPSDALQAINAEADTTSCTYALVMFTSGRLIGQLAIKGKLMSIVEVTVHAVGNGAKWKPVPELTQYIVIVEKGVMI